MAADSFVVPPVERRPMPQVVRRIGVPEYQPQKEKEHPGQSGAERKNSDKKKDKSSQPSGCVVSDHKIDCKV